jgi:hypothetical protein
MIDDRNARPSTTASSPSRTRNGKRFADALGRAGEYRPQERLVRIRRA